VDHHNLASKLLRARIDAAEECHKDSQLDDLSDDIPASDEGLGGHPHNGHFKLGALSQPVAIQDIERAQGDKDRAFSGFRHKFTQYLRTFLPNSGTPLLPSFNIPGNFLVFHVLQFHCIH